MGVVYVPGAVQEKLEPMGYPLATQIRKCWKAKMSLSVTVNSASNLPNVDVLDDVSDPYTRITLKGESII